MPITGRRSGSGAGGGSGRGLAAEGAGPAQVEGRLPGGGGLGVCVDGSWRPVDLGEGGSTHTLCPFSHCVSEREVKCMADPVREGPVEKQAAHGGWRIVGSLLAAATRTRVASEARPGPASRPPGSCQPAGLPLQGEGGA